jgi:Cft2 family RNA processing exonuclease
LILATVRGDGNVLMPVDSSARVLELVLLLENFWHDNK